jgi:small redox-active disulfide protein 2
MNMEVKILGTGCPNCKRVEKRARETLAEMGVEATVTKVTDMADILSYNIPATPGLVIDGNIVSYGQVPTKAEIASLITTALAGAKEES